MDVEDVPSLAIIIFTVLFCTTAVHSLHTSLIASSSLHWPPSLSHTYSFDVLRVGERQTSFMILPPVSTMRIPSSYPDMIYNTPTQLIVEYTNSNRTGPSLLPRYIESTTSYFIIISLGKASVRPSRGNSKIFEF